MSFETAMSALGALGGKGPGELILADDWNTLVTQVQAMGQALSDGLQALDTRLQGVIDGEIADLQSQLGGLTDRVDALETHVGAPGSTDSATLTGRVAALEGLSATVDALEATVEPLTEQYLVNLSTGDSSYLLGEVAEITAQVRRLDGSIPGNHPWVDVVCTWGTLTAAPGFSALPGATGRSIAVRCDSQGIARVRVRSEQGAGLSQDEEDQLGLFFATQIGSSVKDEILAASSSNAPRATPAYQEAARVYDAETAPAVGKLVDGYYGGQTWGGGWGVGYGAGWGSGTGWGYGTPWGQPTHPSPEWQEYRSTLIAIAKNDSDPTTPDSGRGMSSIQIRFRDWVGPWLGWYLAEDTATVSVATDLIAEALAEDNAGASIQKAQDLIGEKLQEEQGLVRRRKQLESWGKAIDEYHGPDIPDFGPGVMESVKSAVTLQKGLGPMDYAGGGQQVFAGWLGMGASMEAKIGQVQGINGDLAGKVTALSGSVEQMDAKVSEIGGSVTNLNARLSSSEAAASQIQMSLNGIEDKVSGIDALDPVSVQGRLSEITAQLGVIKSKVGGV